MSGNDYVTIRIPETGWGVSWLRENPDVYCILLYGSNTGAALHHPVLRDLISQADQYLTDYETDGILPPSLDPNRDNIRNLDIFMDGSEYSVHYINKKGDFEILRNGIHEDRTGDRNPAISAMARIVNLLRQDPDRPGTISRGMSVTQTPVRP